MLGGVVYLHVAAYAALWLDSHRLWNELRKQDRTITIAQARGRLQEQGGTIVVENPSLTWGAQRIWWSPRDDFEEHNFWDDEIEDAKVGEMIRVEFTNKQRLEAAQSPALLVRSCICSRDVRAFLRRRVGVDDCIFVTPQLLEIYRPWAKAG